MVGCSPYDLIYFVRLLTARGNIIVKRDYWFGFLLLDVMENVIYRYNAYQKYCGHSTTASIDLWRYDSITAYCFCSLPYLSENCEHCRVIYYHVTPISAGLSYGIFPRCLGVHHVNGYKCNSLRGSMQAIYYDTGMYGASFSVPLWPLLLTWFIFNPSMDK